jgi:hypothetical protein
METLSIPTLRRAIENRDGGTLAGYYADDAVLRIIDQMNPPSQPKEIKGSAAIAAYYDDVCGRTMTHRVDTGMMDGDQLAFTQTCTYPDGKRVFCASTMELLGGRVVKQTSIQAWDP